MHYFVQLCCNVKNGRTFVAYLQKKMCTWNTVGTKSSLVFVDWRQRPTSCSRCSWWACDAVVLSGILDLSSVWFSFFSSCRDAEDAVYGRDGYDYDGYRLRVEFPRSGRGTGRGGGGGGGGGAPRGRYGPPSRRSEYRVIVSGKCFLLGKNKFLQDHFENDLTS